MPQAILFTRRSTSCNLQATVTIEIKLIATPQPASVKSERHALSDFICETIY